MKLIEQYGKEKYNLKPDFVFGIEKSNMIIQIRISLESEHSEEEGVTGVRWELWIVEEDDDK